MPTLTIQLPGLPPVEHILREEAITLGRMKGNTIAIDDVSVSLSHAKIIKVGDDYLLKDLNSTNGTMLNGQSINEARLRNGDQLKFGEVLAVFRTELARPATPTPTPGPLVATEIPQAAAHTVTGLIPGPASAVKRSQSPAPTPVFAQATPSSAPTPGPASMSAAAPMPTTPRSGPSAPRAAASAPKAAVPAFQLDKKKLVAWLAPILGGLSAVIVLGIVLWKSFSGGGDDATSTAQVTNTQSSVKQSAPAPNKKTNTTSKAKSPPPAKPSATEKEKPAPPAATSAPVVPPPVQAVPSNAPEVRIENATLADLVTVLRSPDVTLRRRAAQSISSFEGSAKDAIPALRAALNDSDAEVRMWSALALVGNGVYEKVTIPILVEALQHDNVVIRQSACISLALIPCEGADKALVVPALTKVANKDANDEVRRDALTALRVIAPETLKND